MKQTFNLLKAYYTRLHFIAVAFFLLFFALNVQAQKIDFSNGTGNKARVADGYTDWYITETSSGGSVSETFDGVTITIGHNSNSVTAGHVLSRNWYNVWDDDEMLLIHDGIFARMTENSYGDYGATQGVVSVDVKITGLPIGIHTLQAYHNYVMDQGKTIHLPTIGVAVDGETVMTGIEQSHCVDKKSECAKSFVSFNVTSSSQEVTITYFSEHWSLTGRMQTIKHKTHIPPIWIIMLM